MEKERRLVVDPPIPFDRAVELVRSAVRALPAEEVPLGEAQGRVLAGDVAAPHAVPSFENSMVDGYAVRAADLAGASDDRPVELRVLGDITAGGPGGIEVVAGAAARIMTGAPVPPGADAVVMLEWTSFTSTTVRVRRAVEPGRFVRRVGEDTGAGEIVVRAGDRLGAAAIGVLASLGCARVSVHRRPAVSVLATGDELLRVEEALVPGKIRSSNSWTLAGQAREAGAVVHDLGLARDDPAELRAYLEKGTSADVLITSGGVSVGDRDHVQDVLRALGLKRLFWRVSASPGKPLLFGTLGETLVFGVPGNPVSSMVAFENFVRPTLRRLQGDLRPERPRVRAVLEQSVSGPKDRRHFARVRLSWGREGYRAGEVHPHGSGNLRSMVHANALAVLPEGRARAEAGEELEIVVLGEPDQRD